MPNRIVHATKLVTLAAWCIAAFTTPSDAKPRGAPIAVEHDAPRNLDRGAEADITLGFRALADIDQLDVEIVATSGLVIVSGPQKATFSAARRASLSQVVIRVRLTDASTGTLGVTFRTRIGDREQLGAEAVVCGNPGN